MRLDLQVYVFHNSETSSLLYGVGKSENLNLYDWLQAVSLRQPQHAWPWMSMCNIPYPQLSDGLCLSFSTSLCLAVLFFFSLALSFSFSLPLSVTHIHTRCFTFFVEGSSTFYTIQCWPMSHNLLVFLSSIDHPPSNTVCSSVK